MTEPTTAYPHLFSPYRLGRHTLKNRIVHASMSTRYQVKGEVTDRLIDYYVSRAKGGTAMSITEPFAMLPSHLGMARVDVFTGRNQDGLKRWADAVGAHDCLMIAQVQDRGRGSHEEVRAGAPIGASSLPDDLSWNVPHALSTEGVERLVVDFASSARKLRDAGFAGVEISAGHGHLFHQFMAKRSNRREDAFGGDLAGRTKLLTDLLAALRAECGADFLVGVKLPADDGLPDGIDLDEAYRITERVHATGVPDYLTWCWGSHSTVSFDWHLPDLHGHRTPYVDHIAHLAKAAPGVAIGQLGLITDPNEGEKIVRDGLGDLVMLGRPLVTDPAWGIKAEQGREAQIRYCVSCNTCWHVIATGGVIQCDNNPRVGQRDEADWTPPKTDKPRKVVVVGAGIAGMEAAWVAAGRGHDVTVFGAGDEPGGKTRLHAILPGGENLSSIYDYQRLSAERYGADLRFGKKAELDDILALAPDAVVLATGATPAWPAFLPAEYQGEGFFPDLREAVAMLADITAKQPGTAVIYDHDQSAFTYAAAEFFIERFEKVVLVTPRERLGAVEALVNRTGIYRRLYTKGVEVILLVEPTADSNLEEGEVTVANVYSGATQTISDVALFTFATSRAANDELAAPLRAAGIEVHQIGDCFAPRMPLAATAEGYRIGSAL